MEMTPIEIDLALELDKSIHVSQRYRRTVPAQIELLELAIHALNHGRYGVTEEYLERATESLKSIER